MTELGLDICLSGRGSHREPRRRDSIPRCPTEHSPPNTQRLVGASSPGKPSRNAAAGSHFYVPSSKKRHLLPPTKVVPAGGTAHPGGLGPLPRGSGTCALFPHRPRQLCPGPCPLRPECAALGGNGGMLPAAAGPFPSAPQPKAPSPPDPAAPPAALAGCGRCKLPPASLK